MATKPRSSSTQLMSPTFPITRRKSPFFGFKSGHRICTRRTIMGTKAEGRIEECAKGKSYEGWKEALGQLGETIFKEKSVRKFFSYNILKFYCEIFYILINYINYVEIISDKLNAFSKISITFRTCQWRTCTCAIQKCKIFAMSQTVFLLLSAGIYWHLRQAANYTFENHDLKWSNFQHATKVLKKRNARRKIALFEESWMTESW